MISIIVPIYKAEKYIHRCIDSILAQSYTDFELLLIDDGSPDNCGAICDEYAAKDSRVRVFHKANGGVSTARNYGVEKSLGQWITFVDSDDYVHPDFLSSLYSRHDADFIVGSSQVVGSDEVWRGVLDDTYYDKEALRDSVVSLCMSINFQTPWGKLFRADIIRDNNIIFNEKIHLGEDSLFVLSYLLYTNTIQTCSSPYYFYERGNVLGLSQNFYPIEHYFYAMEAFSNVLVSMEQVFAVKTQRIYREYLRLYCSKQIYYLYLSKNSFCYKLKLVNLMCKNKYLKSLFLDKTTYERRKIRLFHLLMEHRLCMMSLIYIYILRGYIYYKR